ncbi:hypothetical protein [Enhygromyxa salina]|nr:hypothetical protein [Enhygromyxa salina]
MPSLPRDRTLRAASVVIALLTLGACHPHERSVEPASEGNPTPGDAAAEPWLFIENEEPQPTAGEPPPPSRRTEGPDGDGDGIPDQVDACPADPEDLDGFDDGDGCPEPDNDLDGILDIDDQCPMEPETFDGHHDEDGCPG